MTDDAPPFKDREGILPGNATPLERAIADVDGRLDDVDTDLVGRVGGPAIDLVPPAFLSRRAWGRSVDIWDPLWPEDIKRAAIVAAPIIHRHKGSVLAVKAALGVLKIDAVVTQWWQETPRGEPYTFTVRAYARARLYDGPLLDAQLISIAYASIMRAKPLSRAFDFVLGVNTPATLGLAAMLAGKVRVARAVVPAQPDTHTRNILGLAPALAGKVRIARAVVPVLPP